MNDENPAAEQLDGAINLALKVLTSAEFLAIEDADAEWVDLSRWAGDGAGVWIRSMTAEERDGYEQGLIKQSQGRNARGGSVEMDLRNARAKLVARCAVNAEVDGVRIFTDGDAAKIGKKNAPMIDALYDVASRVSGIRQEDLDEVLKDFEDGPAEGGSTA